MTRTLRRLAVPAAAACLALAACASDQIALPREVAATAVALDSGDKAWALTCDPQAISSCLQKASEVCPDGFEILDAAETKPGGALRVSPKRGLAIEDGAPTLYARCT